MRCLFLCAAFTGCLLLQAQGRALAAEDPESLLDAYDHAKNKITSADIVSRDVMARLYKINQRMKTISKKRGRLSDKMIATEGDVKVLAKAIGVLEDKIKDQRRVLSRRMRTLYMLGDDRVVRGVFSATGSEDLDQMMKYLRLYADRDYKVIRAYKMNLATLSKKREALTKKVRRLVALRHQVASQEGLLAKEQASKSDVLSNLDRQKRMALRKLKNIRKKVAGYDPDLLNFTFFEQKGKLKAPTTLPVSQDYGLIQNDRFGYRLSHKGLFYEAPTATAKAAVHSVFDGRVAFVGPVTGYGTTLILDHGDHYYTVYSGLHKAPFKRGDRVSANQLLDTDVSSLYFEIRHFSDSVNPKNWFKPKEG